LVEIPSVGANEAFVRVAMVTIFRTRLADFAGKVSADLTAETGQRLGLCRAVVAIGNGFFAGQALSLFQVKVTLAEYAVAGIVDSVAVLDLHLLASVGLFLENESGLAESALLGLLVAVKTVVGALLAFASDNSIARFAERACQEARIFHLVVFLATIQTAVDVAWFADDLLDSVIGKSLVGGVVSFLTTNAEISRIAILAEIVVTFLNLLTLLVKEVTALGALAVIQVAFSAVRAILGTSPALVFFIHEIALLAKCTKGLTVQSHVTD
jgi:hypothetical protein